MDTATTARRLRRLRRLRDPARTLNVRLSLALIRANLVADMSRTDINLRSVENLLNVRSNAWRSSQSPDELVIQKRGRRKSIIWSPDLDTHKRHDLFSSSSKDCTPIKNPPDLDITLRNTSRRKLSLDSCQSEFTTLEKKMRLPYLLAPLSINMPQKQFVNDLATGLRGLSHEQLEQLIMDLVYMQEDGILHTSEKLRDILLKKMPIADIQTLIHKLHLLRRNIYASLVSSNLDDSAYTRAYIHLNEYEKTLVEQGKILQQSQHWISLMHYVLEAFEITRELPEWKNYNHYNITRTCFKNLSQFCVEAIKKGNFETSNLKVYSESLKSMAEHCEDFITCLQVMMKKANCET